MKTVGLSIIAKDEAQNLPNLLASVEGQFDKIYLLDTGSTDDTVKIAREFGCEVTEVGDRFMQKIPAKTLDKMREIDARVPKKYSFFRFDKARNYAFSLVDTDYIVWIDCDDILVTDKNLKQYIHKDYDHGIDCSFWRYDYDRNTHGQTTASHWRERLLKNDPFNFFWKSTVHETPLPKDGFTPVIHNDDNFEVHHKAVTEEHRESSLWRNHLIILQEFVTDGEQTDPRTLSYLGGSFAWRKMPKMAIDFYLKHIETSGWEEDKYRSWRGISNCYKTLGNWDRSIFADQQALTIMTHWPDAWLGLAESYLQKEDYDKCLEYLEIALKKDVPVTSAIVDPTLYGARGIVMAVQAYAQKGKVKEAYTAAKKAKQIDPYNEENNRFLPILADEYNRASYLEHIFGVLDYLDHLNPEKIPELFASIPKDMALDDRVVRLRAQFLPQKVWDKDSVVFVCGGLEPWSPKNTEVGIGGSEEAIIYLTKELAALGRDVTVYNTIESPEVFDGVQYLPIEQFNVADEFGIFVSWRNPGLLGAINAKKRYVDMHDVPSGNFPDNIDKIFVKSKYHKSLLPPEVQDKAVVISNGINWEDFSILENRNDKRAVYASSPDRGLECLLDMWPQVKAQVPDAELVWYYGWENFDKFYSKDPGMMKWKFSIRKKMFDVGAIEGGRVGHKELAREFVKSGVWVYPTEFTEINCITALKAQAAQLIPVTTHCYALAETVQESEPVVTDIYSNEKAQEEYVNRVVAALKSKDRPSYDMNEYYWGEIASKWNAEL